jgi:hypothetical protein
LGFFYLPCDKYLAMASTHRLLNYIEDFESFIPNYKILNPKVSNSTVGWQIDHSLKVINGIIGQLKMAPTDKKSKLTLFGRFCLSTRYIPRGKGKAPKIVLPPENIEINNLNNQIELSKKLIPEIHEVSDKATFKHPYFGILTKNQTVRFIEVHTKHHLKIIRDILHTRNA